MITLTVLCVIGAIVICIAGLLISIIATIFTGIAAIALDILIGLLPVLLIWWLVKRRSEDG